MTSSENRKEVPEDRILEIRILKGREKSSRAQNRILDLGQLGRLDFLECGHCVRPVGVG